MSIEEEETLEIKCKGVGFFMGNVVEKADALASAIAESKEYKDYISLLKIIQGEPDLYSHFNEYRRRSFEIQVSSDVNAVNQLENLRLEFSELLTNSKVSRVLSAEQIFCKMMRQVNAKIMESIEEMDVSFLS